MVGALFSKIIDLILPPVCFLCRDVVFKENSVCEKCWPQISFITVPFCEGCSYPFSFGEQGDHLKCGSCLESPMTFTRTRAVFKYDHFSKNLILPFKHNKAIHFAPLLAQWMERAGKDILQDADLLVPVPLHWSRLLKRGFNQAVVLSRHLTKVSHIPTNVHVLKRMKRTASQGHLTVAEREENVRNSFQVKADGKRVIQGKTVILIDDVLTTGATVNACAKSLLKNGAKEVRVLVAARVLL